MHELNRRTEKVCQGAEFLIHCTVTQLLFLANYNKNIHSCERQQGDSGEEAKRHDLGDLLVSVWKSLKPSKMDRAGLLRFGTAKANLHLRDKKKYQLVDNRSRDTRQRSVPPNNGSGSTNMSCF